MGVKKIVTLKSHLSMGKVTVAMRHFRLLLDGATSFSSIHFSNGTLQIRSSGVDDAARES